MLAASISAFREAEGREEVEAGRLVALGRDFARLGSRSRARKCSERCAPDRDAWREQAAKALAVLRRPPGQASALDPGAAPTPAPPRRT